MRSIIISSGPAQTPAPKLAADEKPSTSRLIIALLTVLLGKAGVPEAVGRADALAADRPERGAA